MAARWYVYGPDGDRVTAGFWETERGAKMAVEALEAATDEEYVAKDH